MALVELQIVRAAIVFQVLKGQKQSMMSLMNLFLNCSHSMKSAFAQSSFGYLNQAPQHSSRTHQGKSIQWKEFRICSV